MAQSFRRSSASGKRREHRRPNANEQNRSGLQSHDESFADALPTTTSSHPSSTQFSIEATNTQSFSQDQSHDYGPLYTTPERGATDTRDVHETLEGVHISPSTQYLPFRSPSFTSTYHTDNSLNRNEFLQRNEKFFKPGRVFSCLWTEPAGETANVREGDKKLTQVNFASEEYVYSSIQRFVVIFPNYKQHFSICCQIKTYGSRGTAKNLNSHSQHTIIYSGSSEPVKLPKEPEFKKLAIKVDLKNAREPLRPDSRLNFGKPTPVEHNIRVKEIGDVSQDHLETLFNDFSIEYQAMFSWPNPAGDMASLLTRNLGTDMGTQGMPTFVAPLSAGNTLGSPGMESSFPTQRTGFVQAFPDIGNNPSLSSSSQADFIQEHHQPELSQLQSRSGHIAKPSYVSAMPIDDTAPVYPAQDFYQATNAQEDMRDPSVIPRSLLEPPHSIDQAKGGIIVSSNEMARGVREEKKTKVVHKKKR